MQSFGYKIVHNANEGNIIKWKLKYLFSFIIGVIIPFILSAFIAFLITAFFFRAFMPASKDELKEYENVANSISIKDNNYIFCIPSEDVRATIESNKIIITSNKRFSFSKVIIHLDKENNAMSFETFDGNGPTIIMTTIIFIFSLYCISNRISPIFAKLSLKIYS